MSNLKIGKIVLSVCETNCYYVYKEGDENCIVVDPGDKGDYIYTVLKEKGLAVSCILLTHGHFDHIWGCEELRQLSGAKVFALDEERAVLKNANLNVSDMIGRSCTIEADEYVHDMDVLTLNGMKIQVLATPGHTQGSCCYNFVEENTIFTGDTLFEESVGRTDFPTGSGRTLSESISTKLAPLSDDIVVYPGHGSQTTIEHERQYNPFWTK